MNPTSWRTKIMQVAGALLGGAIALNIAWGLIRPLIPIALVLGGLAITWVLVSRWRRW